MPVTWWVDVAIQDTASQTRETDGSYVTEQSSTLRRIRCQNRGNGERFHCTFLSKKFNRLLKFNISDLISRALAKTRSVFLPTKIKIKELKILLNMACGWDGAKMVSDAGKGGDGKRRRLRQGPGLRAALDAEQWVTFGTPPSASYTFTVDGVRYIHFFFQFFVFS